MSTSDRRVDLAAAAVLLVLGLAVAVPHLWTKVPWSPDGLFYEAQTREVRGERPDAALRTVFSGPLATRPREREAAVRPSRRRIDNPEWVAYSAPFYRRRWTVPVLAAALTPVAGEDQALEDASLVGLVLLGWLLFFLLRGAFPPVPSTVATGFCVLLPPVLSLAPHPGTDYAGLARRLSAGRGTRGASGLACALGVVAYLPSLLLFKVPPLGENLAYVLNDYRIPTDTGWGHILSVYPGQLGEVLGDDLRYPLETAVPALTIAMGLVVLAGLANLFRRRRPPGDLTVVARGTLLGAVGTILLSVNHTYLRLELVFVPAAAVGIAALLNDLGERLRESAAWRRRAGAGGDVWSRADVQG
ncbi:MAG TPA: hypothetical protein VHZ54_09190 [Solirubrobacterales bacterium]|nr:hypothetical protein [Solirubrobacterales bacterium]